VGDTMHPALLKAGFILIASAGILLVNSNTRGNISKSVKNLFAKKKKDINYVEPDKIHLS
jgi:hypothetical protein